MMRFIIDRVPGVTVVALPSPSKQTSLPGNAFPLHHRCVPFSSPTHAIGTRIHAEFASLLPQQHWPGQAVCICVGVVDPPRIGGP